MLWFAVASRGPVAGGTPAETIIFGIRDVFYDTKAPALRDMLAAVAVAFLLAASVAQLERRVADRSRRRAHLHTLPLGPKQVMAATRGVYAGPVTVTVLIPAPNEEVSLPSTISSLLSQSRRPDRVIVVADNCTDSTVALPRQAGVAVVESVHNTHKKAGALNKALAGLLPGLGDNDVVMIMDADTRLDDGFLESAVVRFTRDRALMAVGGLFHGEDGHGSSASSSATSTSGTRKMRRRRGRVLVVTGTASLFRSAALRAVAAHRGASIPGMPGDVYDTASLTEDDELTIALKSLGALMISPADCTVVTELMPTRPARVLALGLFPKLFYDMFLNIVFVKGILDISLGRQAK